MGSLGQAKWTKQRISCNAAIGAAILNSKKGNKKRRFNKLCELATPDFFIKILVTIKTDIGPKSLISPRKMAVLCQTREYGDPLHIGLMSRIINGFDSLLLYVVEGTKSYDNIGTKCNQSSSENRYCSKFCMILPWPILLP